MAAARRPLKQFERNLVLRNDALGEFSPTNWTISISSPAAPINRLSQADRLTFEHEFGHLLHYFTTYIGLTDLWYWAQILAVLERPPTHGQAPEAHVTAQAADVLSLARQQQILAIDEF